MATIVTRTGKGSALTFAEGDANFTNLNDDKLEASGGTITGYKETVYTLSYAATITPDVANGNVQKMSCTGDFTFSAFANPSAGQSLTLIIDHNGAARTMTSTMLFAGGDGDLSDSDTVDIMTVFYDGTNYYASIAKNFS
jgi:hypothetical protein